LLCLFSHLFVCLFDCLLVYPILGSPTLRP
jgi:hypothetical protein